MASAGGKLAARYLAIDGPRALSVNRGVLPPSLRPLIDLQTAPCSTSAAASLTLASSRQPLPAPPAAFGVIRAKQVLVAAIGSSRDTNSEQQHVPRRESGQLAALEDEDELDDDGAGAAADMFPSVFQSQARSKATPPLTDCSRATGGQFNSQPHPSDDCDPNR
jgi:hypothetical protein